MARAAVERDVRRVNPEFEPTIAAGVGLGYSRNQVILAIYHPCLGTNPDCAHCRVLRAAAEANPAHVRRARPHKGHGDTCQSACCLVLNPASSLPRKVHP